MYWIKHGWGLNYSNSVIKDTYYYVNINNIIFSTNAAIDNSILTVLHITKNYPPPYYLLVSGGNDSQVMTIAWQLSKVPHKLISFRFDQDYNLHDIKNFARLANKLSLDVTYMDISLFDLFEKELTSLALSTNCPSPQMCAFMKFRQKILNGTVIFSGAPLFSTIELDYSILGLHRYQQVYKQNMVCYFLSETPFIAGSFFEKYKTLLANKEEFNLQKRMNDARIKAYIESGFDICPQYVKTTGFEMYKDYYDRKNINPLIKLKHAHKESKRNFDILFRYELGEKLTLPKQTILISDNKI
jgi:hypothetical protein